MRCTRLTPPAYPGHRSSGKNHPCHASRTAPAIFLPSLRGMLSNHLKKAMWWLPLLLHSLITLVKGLVWGSARTTIKTDKRLSFDEAEANAELIAAASELLNLLEAPWEPSSRINALKVEYSATCLVHDTARIAQIRQEIAALYHPRP